MIESLDIKYSHSFYRPELKLWARQFLKFLPEDVGGLISRGSSGCAIASAMVVLSKRELQHVYVRKDGEKSHTTYHAGDLHKELRWAVVDDFYARGITLECIMIYAEEKQLVVTCAMGESFGSMREWHTGTGIERIIIPHIRVRKEKT